MAHQFNMQRLIIVYNPNSSQYVHVSKDVLDRLTDLNGYTIGKFVIEKTSFEKNVARLIKVLKDGDLVIAAGGDATAAVSANAILNSKKDATLAVLPYGNFNDLARTLHTKTLDDVLSVQEELQETDSKHDRAQNHSKNLNSQCLYPLEILVDGKHWRYATCYVTIGMTAESVELFDNPKIRKQMQKGHKSSWRSYIQLARWYFKNRHKKIFLPEFKLNGKLQSSKISDYAAVNGRSMCRVMKGRDEYKKPCVFRREIEQTTSFPKLFMLMARSILYRVPGIPTKGDTLEFQNPATVELQAEGEYKVFENIKKIEIKKGQVCLKVIEKN